MIFDYFCTLPFCSRTFVFVFQRVADYLPCSVLDRGASRNYGILICAFSDNVPEIVRALHDDLITTNRKLR